MCEVEIYNRYGDPVSGELAALRAELDRLREDNLSLRQRLCNVEAVDGRDRATLKVEVERLRALLQERADMERDKWGNAFGGTVHRHAAERDWLTRVVKELESTP